MRIRLTKCTGIPFAVDHIWPLAKGGPQHHENLQVIPYKLNNRKLANLSFKHELLKDWTDLPKHLLKWINDRDPEIFKNTILEWKKSNGSLELLKNKILKTRS